MREGQARQEHAGGRLGVGEPLGDEESNGQLQVSEAYDVLSDPQTRKRYDVFGADFRRVPADVDPQTWSRARAGAGPGARLGARPRR